MTNLERFTDTVFWKPADRILTYDFVDNKEILVRYGGYKDGKHYSWEELLDINLKAFKNIGLDVTRYIYDPVNHWMGAKIVNWIRFFGVKPDNWKVSQEGGTAWIAKRPFRDLAGLEKNMPDMPKFEEVREWFEPYIKGIKPVVDAYDIVLIGAVEGPFTDSYSYTDMELFMTAMYDAPELVSRLMDCTCAFSAYISRIFAEHATAPLLFMGEDIAGSAGAIFSPDYIRKEGLPRWREIKKPVSEKGYKFLFHTDGRYGNLLDIICGELGSDGINPIERNGCNDIFEIRKQYPRQLLFGNVCCEVTLPHGNVFDVEDETLELIERIGPERGICIGSSSEVHDLVPVENAAKMYETVHEYGAYPIDVERIRRRRSEIKAKLYTRKP